MLRKIITAAVAASAVAVGLGVATAAPAQAATTSKGTVTEKEAKKLVKEMNRQKCLTAKEAKKIVHGKGHTTKYRYTNVIWNGSKSADFDQVTVVFNKGCAKVVILDAPWYQEQFVKGKKGSTFEVWTA